MSKFVLFILPVIIFAGTTIATELELSDVIMEARMAQMLQSKKENMQQNVLPKNNQEQKINEQTAYDKTQTDEFLKNNPVNE